MKEEEKSKLEKCREQARNARKRCCARKTEEEKEVFKSKERFNRVLRKIQEKPERKAEMKEWRRNYIQELMQDPVRKKHRQEILRKHIKKYTQTPALKVSTGVPE